MPKYFRSYYPFMIVLFVCFTKSQWTSEVRDVRFTDLCPSDSPGVNSPTRSDVYSGNSVGLISCRPSLRYSNAFLDYRLQLRCSSEIWNNLEEGFDCGYYGVNGEIMLYDLKFNIVAIPILSGLQLYGTSKEDPVPKDVWYARYNSKTGLLTKVEDVVDVTPDNASSLNGTKIPEPDLANSFDPSNMYDGLAELGQSLTVDDFLSLIPPAYGIRDVQSVFTTAYYYKLLILGTTKITSTSLSSLSVLNGPKITVGLSNYTINCWDPLFAGMDVYPNEDCGIVMRTEVVSLIELLGKEYISFIFNITDLSSELPSQYTYTPKPDQSPTIEKNGACPEIYEMPGVDSNTVCICVPDSYMSDPTSDTEYILTCYLDYTLVQELLDGGSYVPGYTTTTLEVACDCQILRYTPSEPITSPPHENTTKNNDDSLWSDLSKYTYCTDQKTINTTSGDTDYTFCICLPDVFVYIQEDGTYLEIPADDLELMVPEWSNETYIRVKKVCGDEYISYLNATIPKNGSRDDIRWIEPGSFYWSELTYFDCSCTPKTLPNSYYLGFGVIFCCLMYIGVHCCFCRRGVDPRPSLITATGRERHYWKSIIAHCGRCCRTSAYCVAGVLCCCYKNKKYPQYDIELTDMSDNNTNTRGTNYGQYMGESSTDTEYTWSTDNQKKKQRTSDSDSETVVSLDPLDLTTNPGALTARSTEVYSRRRGGSSGGGQIVDYI